MMNTAKAIAICKDLGNGMYSDQDKARAIHQVLFGRLPVAAIDAEFVLGIAKWLFNRVYIFDI